MYRFGDCEVDGPGREVLRAGLPVHLEPQAFDLLVLLLQHRDRVVSKIELIDGVWGHRFVSEANLTTRIKEVRRAVGDDGTRQHTVKNVRGRGYRFIASVEVVESAPAPRGSRGMGLIGRDDEVTVLLDLITSSRLVTLIGPGGVGKSTLARVVAAAAATASADAAQFVDLATVDANGRVLPVVAHALDIVFDSDRPDDAVGSIAHLDTLLVLDNCEHVIDEVCSLLDRLLSVARSRVRVLATSQVRLGLSVEDLVAVGPLTVGAASELFAARARAVLSGFDLDEIGPDRVNALVAGLDLLPLTIEMAAARLGSMTFDELEWAMRDGMPLLQVTHRTPARRHRSLDSLVAWSARLLDPHQRRVFTEFSVFAGAVAATDAGAVLGPEFPAAVVFDLASLSERSLLLADVSGPATRYRMLTTVRAVANRWLEESGSGDDVSGRHAEHIAGALRSIDDELRMSDEAEARSRLDDIVAEVRVAHRWARDHRPELASQMSGSLFLAAYSGLWHEPGEWSRVLLGQRHDGDTAGLLGARMMVAAAAAHRGDLTYAREQAAAVADAGEGRVRAIAVELLADVALYEGDLAGAARAADELRRLGEDLGDPHALAFSAVDSALARVYGGDPEGALEALRSVELAGLAPSDRAWLAYTRGDALSMLFEPDAAAAFQEAIDLGSAVGNWFVISVSRTSLATEHARAGALDLALGSFDQCLLELLRRGNLTHAVTAIRNLIGVLAAIGDDRGASVLAGAMSNDELRMSYGAEAERVSEVLGQVEQRVGTSCFSMWTAEGRALDLDQAVRVAADLVGSHGI